MLLHENEIVEGRIELGTQIGGKLGDEFELENLRPTVAKKGELEVCLYFFPNRMHV